MYGRTCNLRPIEISIKPYPTWKSNLVTNNWRLNNIAKQYLSAILQVQMYILQITADVYTR